MKARWLGVVVLVACKQAPSPNDGSTGSAAPLGSAAPSASTSVVAVVSAAPAPALSPAALARAREEIVFRVDAGYDAPSAIVDKALAAAGEGSGAAARAIVEHEVEGRLAEHQKAQATWTGPTVAERIERAFAKLERDGVVSAPFFGTSQDDADPPLRERAEAAKKAGRPVRGMVYFTQTDLKNARDGHRLLVYSSPIGTTSDAAHRSVIALVISRLQGEGLKVDWPYENPAYVPAITGVEWKKRRSETDAGK